MTGVMFTKQTTLLSFMHGSADCYRKSISHSPIRHGVSGKTHRYTEMDVNSPE